MVYLVVASEVVPNDHGSLAEPLAQRPCYSFLLACNHNTKIKYFIRKGLHIYSPWSLFVDLWPVLRLASEVKIREGGDR